MYFYDGPNHATIWEMMHIFESTSELSITLFRYIGMKTQEH